jgi:hypothetical protein
VRIETVQRPLRELVREFAAGEILLPQFQRDYVWKPTKIRNLLDSLLQEFPIGGFYLWRPVAGPIDPKPKRFDQARVSPEFRGYLIDGQQRLTSLEAAFGLYTGEDKGGVALRCYLDLDATNVERRRDTRLFVSYGGRQAIARRVDAGDPKLIPVSHFFGVIDKAAEREDEKRLVGALDDEGWDNKRIEQALQRVDAARSMLSQEVPCTTVLGIDDRQAVEVFSRLNKGGTPLRQGDVIAAELARGASVGVLKQMREFVAADRPRRLGFGFSFAFRALVVFHRESAQFTALKEDWMDAPGPHGRNLEQSWKATEQALVQALVFADETMGWSRRLLLPSVNSLIVLANAFDKVDGRQSSRNEQFFRQWLCLTALRNVFQGSVESTMNRFLRALKQSSDPPGEALVGALRRHEGRRIRGEEFTGPSQLWAAPVQVMHAWLVNRGARDWMDPDRTIDSLARAEVAKYPGGDLTVHHIFPREVLGDIQLEGDTPNRPANFALISRSTNSEFGAKPPDEVFHSLTPDQRKAAAVQFFGEGAGDRLRTGKFEEFCRWRGECLAEAINEYLGLD